MSWYCDVAQDHPLHRPYHDTEYGFPTRDNRVIFERMAMEIMQAGLSWEIVLKKREALNEAFHGFDLAAVAAMGEADVARLLKNAGIIRNRLKIESIIENARRSVALCAVHGSLAGWLDSHHPLPKEGWVKLMRKTYRFMGAEIVGEWLMGLGYLAGAHHEKCPIYQRIIKLNPPFLSAPRGRG